MVVYEDFTRYTEYDPDDKVTVGINSVLSTSLRRDDIAYVRQDYGTPNQFGDFDHDFTFNVASIDIAAVVDLWVLTKTESNNTHQKCFDNRDGICVYLYRDASNIYLYLRVFENGGSPNGYAISTGTTYYCTITRTGTTVTLQIYSDADRTALLSTITRTCTTDTYRYIYAMMSRGEAASDKITATVSDYNLNIPWTNQTACELGGCYWWDSTCNEGPRFPYDQLASGYLANFENFVVKGYFKASGDYRTIEVNASGQVLTDVEVEVSSGLHVVTQPCVCVNSGNIHIMSGFINIGSGILDVNIVSSIEVQVDISGDPVIISGQPVTISGDHVFVESGAVVGVSGQLIQAHVISGILDIVNISISGQPVTISGDHVYVESGVQTIEKIPSEVVIHTSGNPMAVGSISGGINILSGAVISVLVKALTTNSGDIYIGGNNEMPYSGQGLLLEAGEAVTIPIYELGHVRAFAEVSGDKISYLATR